MEDDIIVNYPGGVRFVFSVASEHSDYRQNLLWAKTIENKSQGD